MCCVNAYTVVAVEKGLRSGLFRTCQNIAIAVTYIFCLVNILVTALSQVYNIFGLITVGR